MVNEEFPPNPLEKWGRKLQIAQNGLQCSKDPFDQEHFQSIQEIASEVAAYQSGQNPEPLEILRSEKGYATPKVDIWAVIFQENKLLFVRDKKTQVWSFPGGFAHVNESPSHCIETEIAEESGFHVKTTRLLAVYDRLKQGHPTQLFHYYKIFFQCNAAEKITSFKIEKEIEADAAEFYSESEVPRLSTSASRSGELHLQSLSEPDMNLSAHP